MRVRSWHVSVVASGLIVAGCAILLWLAIPHGQANASVATFQPGANTAAIEPASVIRVHIPRLGINVLVQPGVYNAVNATWQLTSTSAFAMTQPAPPTLTVYGHATRAIFGNLAALAPGDSIFVTANGVTYEYIYAGERALVSPTDVRALQRREPGIFLITCYGLFSQQRLILYAEPQYRHDT